MRCRPFAPRRALIAALCCLAPVGCAINIMALPYFLSGAGDPMIEPRVPLVKEKKDSKSLLVLVYADSSLRWGYDSIDNELTSRLIANISAGEPRLKVEPERKVREWRDRNPDWAQFTLQKIGEKFDVDYVMFVDISNFTLNESKNQFLLQGKTKMSVRIHDVNKNESLHNGPYTRQYPPTGEVPLTDVGSEEQFQQRFLQTVARELSWFVTPHKMEDGFGDRLDNFQ